jgi:hypothetical protein
MAPPGERPILPPAARELGGRVDTEAMSREVSATILRVCYADRAEDPDFVAALDRSVRDNIRTILGLFAGQVNLDSARPEEALAFADLSATLGIPISTLERAYLVGVADFWRRWFDRCRIEADERQVPLDALVREPTILLFQYIDHVLTSVVSRYDQTRAEMVHTREHLRRTVLSQILSGAADPADTAELERGLAYPLSATHVAMSFEAEDRAEVDRRAEVCRSACDATDVLAHQNGARRFTVWLGRRDGYVPSQVSALRCALERDGASAVLSEPWAGLGGLRRTYDELVMAIGVQRALRGRAGDVVIAYRDVRLDALLLADRDRATRFLEEELGELAGPDPRLRLLREALLVSLSTGSHVSAAALLGVHENTVRNRVRRAEELLPRGVTLGRRTELQVALRLALALGDGSAGDVSGDRRLRH